MKDKAQIEYGDWQTNEQLALSVCQLLHSKGVRPQVVIEPTCGKGNFLSAALQTFDTITDIIGIEINAEYLSETSKKVAPYSNAVQIHLFCNNIFSFDFSSIKSIIHGKQILVLGNPPWVTNSRLGILDSKNLPVKSNFKGQKGIEAITGKGNFDIAEYICYQMFRLVSDESAHFAILLKSSTIKNIVYRQAAQTYPIADIEQYNIDAKREFNASVSAALFYGAIGNYSTKQCPVYDFYSRQHILTFGWTANKFVADTELYHRTQEIDGLSPFEWRSGVKHDCAKVMELKRIDGTYINGFNDIVDIEEEVIYPLLKSSDVGDKTITHTEHFVVITQHSPSDDTANICRKYPKAYQYLLKYANFLDNRKSSIYHNRTRFCMFGIGKYTFSPYKVVVSGLYKHTRFSLVPPIEGRPVVVDDTCYAIGFDNVDDAQKTIALLNSHYVQTFLQSLLFADAKRVISKDMLMRIDLSRAANILFSTISPTDETEKYVKKLKIISPVVQTSLFGYSG